MRLRQYGGATAHARGVAVHHAAVTRQRSKQASRQSLSTAWPAELGEIVAKWRPEGPIREAEDAVRFTIRPPSKNERGSTALPMENRTVPLHLELLSGSRRHRYDKIRNAAAARRTRP